MLKSTFQCFAGVGAAGEAKLWENGCLCWADVRNGTAGVSACRQRTLDDQIATAETAYSEPAVGWFLDRLKGPAQLRVLHDFMAEALFLDIETTGLSPGARVTTAATWRNGVARCFVDGFNLDELPLELVTATMLVTYNGKRFDLPVLRHHFGLDLALPHLDLMVPLRGLGYRGGLKVCEQRLGFRRQHSGGTEGAEAVYLWYAWRRSHDTDALRKLIVYNLEDTFSLAWLAARVLPRSMPGYPHPMPAEDPPPPPDCRDVLARFSP